MSLNVVSGPQNVNCSYRYATIDDIEKVMKLHYKYQVDSIAVEDKIDGFVTTPFTAAELKELVQEQGLFVADLNGDIVAYVMAASWQYWSKWAMFEFMISNLDGKTYKNIELNTNNSYQYGPVCVDKLVRGSGVFEGVFAFALQEMSKKYDVLVTFVNKINPRSFAAHTKKVHLDVISEFEFNGNHYDEMACLTKR